MTPQEYLNTWDIDKDVIETYKSMSTNEREIWKKGYLQAVKDTINSSEEDYSDAIDYLNALNYLVERKEQ